MSQKFAMIFPGQGSQKLGLLANLAQKHAIVKEVFDQGSALLGYDLWELAQHGPKPQLDQTEFTQPIMLAADVAVFRCWRELGAPMPAYMAGHSLGEYAALVCADALSYTDAVQLVSKRGRYMQDAVPMGHGAMGAIIGLDADRVSTLCAQVAAEEATIVGPANFNAPNQVVIAGNGSAVDRVLEQASTLGAKKMVRIPVSVPAHCLLMQPAADRLLSDFQGLTMSTPSVPVLHNVDVKRHPADQIPAMLMQQLIGPVYWTDTITTMLREGITLFLESGPGRVLTGLNKRISSDVVTMGLDSPLALASALAAVND